MMNVLVLTVNALIRLYSLKWSRYEPEEKKLTSNKSSACSVVANVSIDLRAPVFDPDCNHATDHQGAVQL